MLLCDEAFIMNCSFDKQTVRTLVFCADPYLSARESKSEVRMFDSVNIIVCCKSAALILYHAKNRILSALFNILDMTDLKPNLQIHFLMNLSQILNINKSQSFSCSAHCFCFWKTWIGVGI